MSDGTIAEKNAQTLHGPAEKILFVERGKQKGRWNNSGAGEKILLAEKGKT